MEKNISATEAVRGFSEIMNNVKFTGARYIVERNGKPIVSIGPVMGANHSKTLKELKSILQDFPKLGREAERFSDELKKIATTQPLLPENGSWE